METIAPYIDKEKFFAAIRGGENKLFKTLSQIQVDRINMYIDYVAGLKLDKHQFAYILATVYHETGVVKNGVMQRFIPVEETGKGKNKKYGKCIKFDGKAYTDTNNLYYGRGDVQLTWYENYKRAEIMLNIKGLFDNPELALQSEIAMKIAVNGMIVGLFTGRKLSSYHNKDGSYDYEGARYIINVQDKAKEIANIAKQFYAAML